MVLGSVEDEKFLFNLFSMKKKLTNCLTNHLDFVVWIYAQSFYTMETFPFTVDITSWSYQILGPIEELKGCKCIIDMKIA
jgi:hypothetical protein